MRRPTTKLIFTIPTEIARAKAIQFLSLQLGVKLKTKNGKTNPKAGSGGR